MTGVFYALLAVRRGWNGRHTRESAQESSPWRRKFSRRRCRGEGGAEREGSNSRPADHEFGALPAELYPISRPLRRVRYYGIRLACTDQWRRPQQTIHFQVIIGTVAPSWRTRLKRHRKGRDDALGKRGASLPEELANGTAFVSTDERLMTGPLLTCPACSCNTEPVMSKGGNRRHGMAA